jgi:VanZ family protein
MSHSLLDMRAARLLPPMLVMLIIFLLSSQSSVPQTNAIPSAITAALGHLFVYAVLAVLVFRALGQNVESFWIRAPVAWLATTLYGVSDEIHQSFVPGRNASVLDVGIDATGAALGLLLVYLVIRVRNERQIPA